LTEGDSTGFYVNFGACIVFGSAIRCAQATVKGLAKGVIPGSCSCIAFAVGVFRFRKFRVLIPRRQRQPVGFVDAPHVSWAGAEIVLSGSVVWRITCPAALVNFPQGIGDIPIELIYQLAVTGKVHLAKAFIGEGPVQPMGVANGAAEIGITSAR